MCRLLAILALLASACSQRQAADLVVHNAKIVTVDDAWTVASAMAVILSSDLTSIEPDRLMEIQVDKTYLGGKLVYSRQP